MILISGWLLYRRYLKVLLLVIVYIIFLFTLIWPAVFSRSAIKFVPDVYYQNILILNRDIDVVTNYIKRLDSRIVALVEVPIRLEEDLSTFYEYKNSAQGSEGGRCVIFSDKNYPEVLYPELTYPVCAIQTPEYQLLVIHPTPPFGKNLLQKQLTHFAEVSEIVHGLNDRGEKFILVGDFNSGSYARYFRDYFGDYFKTNFYTWLPKTPFTIPIDHALSNLEIDVSIGPTLGSDHAGLIIDDLEI